MSNPPIARAASILAALALAAAGALLAAPAAGATLVGLSAEAQSPSRCYPPKGNVYASTSCQVFAGSPLSIIALASRDDGSVRLMAQPFTLLELRRRGGPRPVASFTLLDGNDADDRPLVTPRRDTDYQLRFEGNADIGPATSATMAVAVGARLTIPDRAGSGRGAGIRVPVGVSFPGRALRGRIELRRCHRAKAFSARSCARARSYTVIGTRRATRARRTAFRIAAPPRTQRRYEVAYRPASRGFTVSRRAFTVTNGYDGRISYRPTVRRAPFGNR